MIRAHPAHLEHDPSRVVARFFLPGDGLPSSHSRVTQIVARVLNSPARLTQETADHVGPCERAGSAGRPGTRHQ